MAKAAVRYARAVHLIVEALSQNRVVRLRNGNIVDQQITHHSGLFTANIDLRHRPKAAHRQPLDNAIRAAHVQGDIFGAPFPFADHFAAFLKDETPASVAGQRTADQQRFAIGNKNTGVNIFAG
ncbi:hypothetical protein D3C72_1648670 [compost metagenome]